LSGSRQEPKPLTKINKKEVRKMTLEKAIKEAERCITVYGFESPKTIKAWERVERIEKKNKKEGR
jgi:hypothetical protein